MTNPVILLGTQSNGETLPVQVDATGRLVAEGLRGPEGPEGPPGVGQLPPDPYEGALLGWLNGELAWVGTPPIPLPENAFGPIIRQVDVGQLQIEGDIPPGVVNGVYLTQVDAQGEPYIPGENLSRTWSDGNQSGISYNGAWDEVFNGVQTRTTGDGNSIYVYRNYAKLVLAEPLPRGIIRLWAFAGSNSTPRGRIEVSDGFQTWSTPDLGRPEDFWIALNNGNALEGIREIKLISDADDGNGVVLGGIKIDNDQLVNNEHKLQLRVNSVVGDLIIGVPTRDKSFTPGSLLLMPASKIAPWVLYGNDPTSLIDHLRQERD